MTIPRHAVAGCLMLLALALALALPVTGCGDDDNSEAAPERAAEAPAQIDPNKDPYEITCADLADVSASAELVQRAQFTLADDAKLKKLSRQQAARSITYAMTEICKSEPEDATPAQDAIDAVKQGKYIAG